MQNISLLSDWTYSHIYSPHDMRGLSVMYDVGKIIIIMIIFMCILKIYKHIHYLYVHIGSAHVSSFHILVHTL